jgi:hypothetical protein
MNTTGAEDVIAAIASLPPFLTAKPAAAHAGMTLGALRRLCAQGRGPHAQRVGRRLVFDLDELNAWLAARRRGWTLDTGDA